MNDSPLSFKFALVSSHTPSPINSSFYFTWTYQYHDNYGVFLVGTDTTDITLPFAGVYLIGAMVSFNSNTTLGNYYYSAVVRNQATTPLHYAQQATAPISLSHQGAHNYTTIVDADAGDTISLLCQQGGGASSTVSAVVFGTYLGPLV